MTNTPQRLPMPPIDLRAMVGPRDEEDFDNPTGRPVFADLGPGAYRSVFDFGCGCGRLARRMIQQTPRPERYVGVDANRLLLGWAAANLAPSAPGFRFLHHDVYAPGYAPGNSLRLSAPFPVEDGWASLFIAASVFTHLSLDQSAYYLSEVRRILAADGVAWTTWFFFDGASTPFLPCGPFALYADEKDFAAAVLYDRRWFLAAVRQAGLTVLETVPPKLPGHQWEVRLGRRQEGSVDRFPIDAEWSEFLCGATLRPRAASPDDLREVSLGRTGRREGAVDDEIVVDFRPPRLAGPLAELAAWRTHGVLRASARTIASWLGLRR
ncbi:MAG: class I SAM-dependent methyltransferase [Planctomycetia bacterium]|nr:class I SAM-dependent methyltransferase [Planctomycetia bacterium]